MSHSRLLSYGTDCEPLTPEDTYLYYTYRQNNNDDAEDDDNQNMRKYIQNYSDTESHQLQH